jgi:hypothetical protein
VGSNPAAPTIENKGLFAAKADFSIAPDGSIALKATDFLL